MRLRLPFALLFARPLLSTAKATLVAGPNDTPSLAASSAVAASVVMLASPFEP